MDYRKKYLKYKNKYIQLKKLVGGIDLNEKWSLIDIDNDTSITTELDKKYKYNLLQMNFTNQRPKQVKHFEKILNNLIEKPESKILLYRQKIYANDGSTEICDTYVTCLDYNIILEKKEEYKQIPALKQLPTNQLDFDTNTNISPCRRLRPDSLRNALGTKEYDWFGCQQNHHCRRRTTDSECRSRYLPRRRQRHPRHADRQPVR